MEDELISIIIPVYNVEKYLRKSIESVLDQTYEKIEILLIDDGSTDSSGKMCEEFAQIDNRILVYHKENSGLSGARNYGIDKAKGNFIVFLDSDDYIDKRFVELMYNNLISSNCDLVQCGIDLVDDQLKVINKYGYAEKTIISNKQFLNDMFTSNPTENVVVWNKMYKKEYFEKFRFKEGKIHEDEFFTYKLIYELNNICILEECLYNYRKNSSSITGKKYHVKRLDIIEALEGRLEFFKEKNEENFYNITLKRLLDVLRINYVCLRKNIVDSKPKQTELFEKYRKYYFEYRRKSKYNLKLFLKYDFFLFFKDIYFYLKAKKDIY